MGLGVVQLLVEERAFRPAFDGTQERALAPAALDRGRSGLLPMNTDTPLAFERSRRARDSFECIRDDARSPRHRVCGDS